MRSLVTLGRWSLITGTRFNPCQKKWSLMGGGRKTQVSLFNTRDLYIYLHKGVEILRIRKTAPTRVDLHVGNGRKGVQGVTCFVCDIILFWGPQF